MTSPFTRSLMLAETPMDGALCNNARLNSQILQPCVFETIGNHTDKGQFCVKHPKSKDSSATKLSVLPKIIWALQYIA